MRGSGWIVVAGILGALGVGLGAFGAHALPRVLADELHQPPEVVAKQLATFDTAVRYHLLHALAILGVGLALARRQSWALHAAGVAFLLGIGLFSGLLYLLVLMRMRWLGAVVPVGGVTLIVGWVLLALSPLTKPWGSTDDLCG